jgi:hypothetical protein
MLFMPSPIFVLMLRFLIPIFFLVLPIALQAEGKSDDADSLYLRKFMREVKIANVESDKADKMSDSQLDKELKEVGMSVMPGSITASPDGRFKIFQVEMEFCGAYCHPEWVSRMLWFNGTDTVVQVLDLYAVYDIFLLEGRQYLFITTGSDRPAGFYTVTIQEAVVMSWTGTEMEEVEAFYSALDLAENTFARLTQVQEMDVNVEQGMYYDTEAKTLSYAYGFAHNIEVNEVTTEEQGVWKWDGKQFVLVDRKQHLGKLGE